MMNVAIIDVGSNNIKLEIHKVNFNGSNELIFGEKINARLGNQAFVTKKLNPENIRIAIQGLKHFAHIIQNFNCKKTIAVGTAALREANYENFIDDVYKETGIKISIISGVEEARLVYLGSLARVPFGGRTFFLMDIGGGSTEISVSNHEQVYFINSLNLGTVRLKDLFRFDHQNLSNNKLILEHFKMIDTYVSKVFLPFQKDIAEYKIDMGLLTGGTARTLVELLRYHGDKKIKQADGIPIINTALLEKLVEKLKSLNFTELKNLKGLDIDRVDIIIPGAILMLRVLKMAGVINSLVVPYGLRDGALADYVQKKVNPDLYLERQASFKEKGLAILNEKLNLDLQLQHANQCGFIAAKLFDIFKKEYELKEKYRIILYAAALLHDVGSLISYELHHKHTEYLILHSALLGFSVKEKILISLIARYHRKSVPKDTHKAYSKLNKKKKLILKKLIGLLRLTDALDRSYKNIVQDIIIQSNTDKHIILELTVKGDPSLELWSFEKKKDFFEKIYGKNISLSVKHI